MQNKTVPVGAWPWQHRELIWQFARRDVVSRYRGSWLGIGWTVATPLLMLAIYTLVFQFVFQAKWPQADQKSDLNFALNLYAGLIVFNWTSELLARAPRLILEQPNLVTKVVFPLPILGWSSLVASLFQTIISCAIWLTVCMFGGHLPALTWFLIPVILAIHALWLLGMTWLLSSLGVYLRDLNQVVTLSLTGLMFLSPVFYPTSSLPDWLRPVVQLNPLTIPIEAMRSVVLAQTMPDTSALLHSLLSALACWCIGLAVMQRIKSGFSDVI